MDKEIVRNEKIKMTHFYFMYQNNKKSSQF